MRSNSYKLTQEVKGLKTVNAAEIEHIALPLYATNKETINRHSFISSFESLSILHILKQEIFGKN